MDIDQTPIPQTSSTPLPNIPIRKSILPVIIGGIVLLILVGGLSYFLGQRASLKRVQKAATPVPVISHPTANSNLDNINSDNQETSTRKTMTIKLRTGGFPFGTIHENDLSFDVNPSDKVEIKKTEGYSGPNQTLQITSKDAVIKAYYMSEANPTPYEDVPDFFKLTETKLTTKPIFRILDNSEYRYTNYFEESAKGGCKQFIDVPAACGMIAISIEDEKNSIFTISCKANKEDVTECDKFVQNLKISKTRTL